MTDVERARAVLHVGLLGWYFAVADYAAAIGVPFDDAAESRFAALVLSQL